MHTQMRYYCLYALDWVLYNYYYKESVLMLYDVYVHGKFFLSKKSWKLSKFFHNTKFEHNLYEN